MIAKILNEAADTKKALKVFRELNSKAEEFEKVLINLPQDTPEHRSSRMEMIKLVNEIYNSLDEIEHILEK